MAALSFQTRLVRPEGIGTWTFALVPKRLSEKARLRSHQRVKGTIDGVPFASSLMPRGDGILFLVVNSVLREKIGKSGGDAVEVSMELDTRSTRISLPPALRKALTNDVAARKAFENLAPSHRKAFVAWIATAKQDETRDRRLTKILQMLHRGKTLN
ncbi:MAG: YdeI/OmpD-associated family protein [Thermoplasmata archaeon]